MTDSKTLTPNTPQIQRSEVVVHGLDIHGGNCGATHVDRGPEPPNRPPRQSLPSSDGAFSYGQAVQTGPSSLLEQPDSLAEAYNEVGSTPTAADTDESGGYRARPVCPSAPPPVQYDGVQETSGALEPRRGEAKGKVRKAHLTPVSPHCAPIKVVACRVDWFELAFKTSGPRFQSVHRDLLELLKSQERRERNWDGTGEEPAARTKTSVGLGSCGRFAAESMAGGKRVLLKNSQMVVICDPHASHGWCVEVRFTGSYFCDGGGPVLAYQLARSVASHFGWKERRSEDTERVRRIDLAADVAGYEIQRDDFANWVKPGHGRLLRELLPVSEYGNTHDVTGQYVCKGGDIQCMVYDKQKELTLLNPHKAAKEMAAWRAGGWDGEQRVARIEFKFRTKVLKEMRPANDNTSELRLRDNPELLLQELANLWRYATSWTRLVAEGPQRLARRPLSDRWRAVSDLMFEHGQTWGDGQTINPSRRVRVRGGADALQTLGTAMSFLRAIGALPELSDALSDLGLAPREADTDELLDDLTVDENLAWFETLTKHLCEKMGEVLAAGIVEYRVAQQAVQGTRLDEPTAVRQGLAHLIARWAASNALNDVAHVVPRLAACPPQEIDRQAVAS